MQKREKIVPEKVLDDVARLAGGAIGVASGISQNIRAEIKSRADDVSDRLDLVPREDLDRVEAMLQNAIKEQQDLKLRIEKLEKKKK